MLKDAIMGISIGIGVMVTVLVGQDAMQPRSRVELKLDPAVACYEVVSIRPELAVAITFNVCTGQFGLSQFPSNIRRGPAPKDSSVDGAFVRPIPKDAI